MVGVAAGLTGLGALTGLTGATGPGGTGAASAGAATVGAAGTRRGSADGAAGPAGWDAGALRCSGTANGGTGMVVESAGGALSERMAGKTTVSASAGSGGRR
ncbi:MAG TPA: hypothetical protein VF054_13450 [Micromonosporaceae bacterium]